MKKIVLVLFVLAFSALAFAQSFSLGSESHDAGVENGVNMLCPEHTERVFVQRDGTELFNLYTLEHLKPTGLCFTYRVLHLNGNLHLRAADTAPGNRSTLVNSSLGFLTDSASGVTYFWIFPEQWQIPTGLYWVPLGDYFNEGPHFKIFKYANGVATQIAHMNLDAYYAGDYRGINDYCETGVSGTYTKRNEQLFIERFELQRENNELKFFWKVNKHIKFCRKSLFDAEAWDRDESMEGSDVVRTVSCSDVSCGANTYCDPSSLQCVQCLSDDQCGAQVCDLATHLCVARPPGACPAACTFSANDVACGQLPAGCVPTAECPNPMPIGQQCGENQTCQQANGAWSCVPTPPTQCGSEVCAEEQVCVANHCQCPAECVANSTACGVQPPACRGTCAIVGEDCEDNFICINPACVPRVCPKDDCRPQPSQVACGQAISRPSPSDPACVGFEEVCGWSDPANLTGTQCPAGLACVPSTANPASSLACKSTLEIPCGETRSTPRGDLVRGTYCPGATELCDWSLPSPGCVNVSQLSHKYWFNLVLSPDRALWYNLWFQPRLENDRFPDLISFDASGLLKTRLLCVGCSSLSSPHPENAFSISYSKSDSRNGLTHFVLSNNRLVGPSNYARVALQDKTRAIGGNTAGERTEYAIFKLNAGFSGPCVSEDLSLKGETGVAVAPKLRYDWSWGTFGTKQAYCSPSNPAGVYCDSTQFLMSLLERLESVRLAREEGRTSDAALLLQDYNALLMKDGFSEDFLLDFAHAYTAVAFLESPPWFRQNWVSVLQQSGGLVIQQSGATDSACTSQVHCSGQYLVHLSYPTDPAQPIRVDLNFVAAPEIDNPLYSLPIDGSLGEVPRAGESVADRINYGSVFTNASFLLAPNRISPTLSRGSADGHNVFRVEKPSSFEEINDLTESGKRGVVLALQPSVNEIVFSPSVATPVALKVSPNGGKAQSYFRVIENDRAVILSSDSSIGVWTGWGSKGLSNSCMAFGNNALAISRPDAVPPSAACVAANTPNARGFFWPTAGAGETVILESILYTPLGRSASLVNACADNPFRVLSPAFLADETHALPLDYSLTQPITGQRVNVESVQGILEGVRQGAICQASSNTGTYYFWNRGVLLNALNGASNTPRDVFDLGVGAGDICTR